MKKVFLIILLFLISCSGNPPPVPPPPGEVCGNGFCGQGENPTNCPGDCPSPPPPPDKCGNGIEDPGECPNKCPQDCPPPEPTLPPIKKGLSVSFYELLSSKSWDTGTQRVQGYYLDYLKQLREVGIGETRNFGDLNWFWNARRQQGIFILADYLSPYRIVGSSFDFDSTNRINGDYKKRIEDAATYAAANGMQIQLTFVTEGYGNTFFYKMGFTSARHLFLQADHPQYPQPWKRLQQYFKDIAAMTATRDGKKVYKIFEFYNEHEGGSLVDEYTALNKSVREGGRPDYINQLNMPSPLDFTAQELDDYFFWLNKLRTRYSFKINRFSFHGIFTHDDVRNIALICRAHGFPTEIITLATDGATPWREANGRYRFTKGNASGHYRARKTWDDNETNRKAVIFAHVSIVKEAKKHGFTIDLQDMSKWNEQGVVDQHVKRFWKEIYIAY